MQAVQNITRALEIGNDARQVGARARRILEKSATVTEALHRLRERFGIELGHLELAEEFARLGLEKPRTYVARRLRSTRAVERPSLLDECLRAADERARLARSG